MKIFIHGTLKCGFPYSTRDLPAPHISATFRPSTLNPCTVQGRLWSHDVRPAWEQKPVPRMFFEVEEGWLQILYELEDVGQEGSFAQRSKALLAEAFR